MQLSTIQFELFCVYILSGLRCRGDGGITGNIFANSQAIDLTDVERWFGAFARPSCTRKMERSLSVLASPDDIVN